MRIFYAAEYKYPIQKNSRLWYNNLYLPLIDCGYEVIPFDYNITPHFLRLDINKAADNDFIEKNRSNLENALLKQIRAEHKRKKIDVFFSYFYSAICRKEVIEEIKRMGIVTINWFCNASYQFHLVKDIAPAFDYSLVPEKFRLADYKNIGANPIYFQEAANPNIYKPFDVEKDYDVTFTGTKYGDRVQIVNYLGQNGVRMDIFGDGWKRRYIKDNIKKFLMGKDIRFPVKNKNIVAHGSISDENYIRLFSQSKICIGLSSCGETHANGDRILQIRLRDFEAPMCGAFYITEYQEDLAEFYEIGKEIVCYKSKEELLDKIKYYLRHDSEREQIAQAGYKRAQRDHTWQRRFELFFYTYFTK
jgi:spore maturation protein CgeB